MIKFFRKIRYDLIEKNKTGKYLKYAIGEIILVMIGILLALQVNNWNENRKLQNEELNFLLEIRTNLKTNYENFKADSLSNQSYLFQYEKIENYIDEDLKYDIELDSAFGVLTFWSEPYIATSAYKTLQTKGLNLIQNKRLRQHIVDMYEVDLMLLKDYDKSETKISETVTTPFFSKHIRRLHKKSLSLSRPNDFEELKHNKEFHNILSMIFRQRKKGQQYFGYVMIKIQSLIDDIDTEIDSR